MELWGIIEDGFMPVDEKSMTPKERIECQLNSAALDKIHQSLKRKVYDQVSSIESAKFLWENLSVKFDVTPSMCRTMEVPPIVALVFIDPFDYTALRSTSVVSIDNVRAGTSFPLLIFKGMNIVTAPFPYNYIE
jgi:hypothetical protein